MSESSFAGIYFLLSNRIRHKQHAIVPISICRLLSHVLIMITFPPAETSSTQHS
jgi:hypothetical protein